MPYNRDIMSASRFRNFFLYVSGLLFAVALIVGGRVWYFSRRASIPSDNIRDTLTQLAGREGPAAAYRYLKTVHAHDIGRIHLYAHYAGELAYRLRGDDGVFVCDRDFHDGCYHGYFGAYIAERGAASIPQALGLCRKSDPTGGACLHSIGHGLARWYKGDIVKALADCATLSDRYQNCGRGIYMEYLDKLLLETSNLVVPTPDQVRAFCLSATAPYGGICANVYGLTLSELFTQPKAVETYCLVMSGTERAACAVGVGDYVGIVSGGDPSYAWKVCNELLNQDIKVACVGRAASVIALRHGSEDQAQRLCGMLSPDKSKVCIAHLHD